MHFFQMRMINANMFDIGVIFMRYENPLPFGSGFSDTRTFVCLNCFALRTTINQKRSNCMRTKKYRLYLDEYEVNIIIKSLLLLRNEVIANGGYGDSVNELIEKVVNAPRAKFKF